MNTPDQEADWGERYSDRRRRYQEFALRLRTLLQELLLAEGVDVVQIDARAKEVESFVEKIRRQPGKYADPLVEIHDFAGVRVVAYYLSDVARIDALIEREFNVDRRNSWKREERTDPDRFGYASDHYVVSCSDARAALAEWRPYADLVAEIQVRTVLQHAWAAIDHKLAYKRSHDLPDEFRRQLSRVSALLEVADEQFEAARAASGRLNATYETRTRAGDLILPVDGASLRAYLSESDVVRRLQHIGELAGFVLDPVRDSGIAELRAASEAAHFDSIEELDSFLIRAEPWAEHALRRLRESRSEPSRVWRMSSAFLLAVLVWLGSGIKLERVRDMTSADDFFIDALRAARESVPVEP